MVLKYSILVYPRRLDALELSGLIGEGEASVSASTWACIFQLLQRTDTTVDLSQKEEER